MANLLLATVNFEPCPYQMVSDGAESDLDLHCITSVNS